MGLLNKTTKSLSGNMAFLTRAFQGWLGFLGVRELTRMSDEMQNLFNRLKLTTGSLEAAQGAMGTLLALAQRTNQSISGVGEIFNRLAVSLKGSGASVGELATLTESLINSFRLAGATTTETTNTIIQLSQAFASGELRGQELRSVMEQNATLAGLLRERFGQDIYKKAADGAIRVTDVLKILAANQTRINEEAKKLAPTFEQTLTKSMNTFSVAVGEINEKFGLSSIFANVMEVAMQKLGLALAVAGSAAVVFAVVRLPALIKAINALRIATLALVTTNPLLAALTAISVVTVLVISNFDSLVEKVKWVGGWFLDLAANIRESMLTLNKFTAHPLSKSGMAKELQTIADMRKKAFELQNPKKEAPKVEEDPAKKAEREMDSLIKKIEGMQKASGKLAKIKDILGAINKEFQDGKIDINEYNKRLISFELYKVNREFREGKTDIFKYHEQLRDLKIQDLNRELKATVITYDQFNAAVASEKLTVLNEKFSAGKINLKEYNEELLKLEDKVRIGSAFQLGVASYIESVGTLSQGIAKGIEQAFGHLEDSFMEFVKTGNINWKNFAQAVLDDLTKIIIRAAVIKPLGDALLNGLSLGGGSGGGSGGGGSLMTMPQFAKGGAFDGGKVIPFAKGGLVDSPTTFSYGGGKRGLMGEAGTEAILPLARSGNGDLGVQASVTPVTVNIINQSGAQVEQRETTGPSGERTLDILITSKVREALVTGKFDGAMRTSYGVTRKGS